MESSRSYIIAFESNDSSLRAARRAACAAAEIEVRVHGVSLSEMKASCAIATRLKRHFIVSFMPTPQARGDVELLRSLPHGMPRDEDDCPEKVVFCMCNFPASDIKPLSVRKEEHSECNKLVCRWGDSEDHNGCGFDENAGRPAPAVRSIPAWSNDADGGVNVEITGSLLAPRPPKTSPPKPRDRKSHEADENHPAPSRPRRQTMSVFALFSLMLVRTRLNAWSPAEGIRSAPTFLSRLADGFGKGIITNARQHFQDAIHVVVATEDATARFCEVLKQIRPGHTHIVIGILDRVEFMPDGAHLHLLGIHAHPIIMPLIQWERAKEHYRDPAVFREHHCRCLIATEVYYDGDNRLLLRSKNMSWCALSQHIFALPTWSTDELRVIEKAFSEGRIFEKFYVYGHTERNGMLSDLVLTDTGRPTLCEIWSRCRSREYLLRMEATEALAKSRGFLTWHYDPRRHKEIPAFPPRM